MIEQVNETAKTISEVGVMETISAAFLVVAIVIIGVLIWYFKKFITIFIDEIKSMIKELLEETKRQNQMLNEISEGLKPMAKERVKVIASAYFDLAMFKVLAFIKRIKKENHIDKKEETLAKIKKWVSTLHSDRKTKFDNFEYRGKLLSSYLNPQWVDNVSEVIEKEVYDPDPNDDRSFTNVKGVYDEIKIDYYDRMNRL